jgi:hypothetical protein
MGLVKRQSIRRTNLVARMGLLVLNSGYIWSVRTLTLIA